MTFVKFWRAQLSSVSAFKHCAATAGSARVSTLRLRNLAQQRHRQAFGKRRDITFPQRLNAKARRRKEKLKSTIYGFTKKAFLGVFAPLR